MSKTQKILLAIMLSLIVCCTAVFIVLITPNQNNQAIAISTTNPPASSEVPSQAILSREDIEAAASAINSYIAESSNSIAEATAIEPTPDTSIYPTTEFPNKQTAMPANKQADPTQVIDTPAPIEDKQSYTVYITKTGEKYHSTGCQYLSKSCIPIDLNDAKAQGYTPCSKCDP